MMLARVPSSLARDRQSSSSSGSRHTPAMSGPTRQLFLQRSWLEFAIEHPGALYGSGPKRMFCKVRADAASGIEYVVVQILGMAGPAIDERWLPDDGRLCDVLLHQAGLNQTHRPLLLLLAPREGLTPSRARYSCYSLDEVSSRPLELHEAAFADQNLQHGAYLPSLADAEATSAMAEAVKHLRMMALGFAPPPGQCHAAAAEAPPEAPHGAPVQPWVNPRKAKGQLSALAPEPVNKHKRQRLGALGLHAAAA
eukprot:6521949-Prymnesium_polylepis.1